MKAFTINTGRFIKLSVIALALVSELSSCIIVRHPHHRRHRERVVIVEERR